MASGISELAAGGRFEVGGLIGQGGAGLVYQAFDRERGRRVALKTLRRADARTLARFKREFRAAQELHHPNLVELYELFEADGNWFYAMELVEGSELLAHVRPGDTVDFDRLRDALIQLARALGFLHEAGLVHRDVKPRNVLATAEGRVVLVDFGLVLAEVEAEASADSSNLGTAAYMAPEQASAQTVGPPADCYALGVLLYECLTGRLPFEGAPLAMMVDKQLASPPSPRDRNPRVPEELDRLCMELLQFDPAERADADTVLERLGAGRNDRRYRTTSRGTGAASFVGRTAELAVLAAAMAQVRAGRPRMVQVIGDAGVGKTSLVDQFLAELRAGAEPVTIFRGRCHERELVRYKVFDAIADQLGRYLQGLPAEQAVELVPAGADVVTQLFPALNRVEVIARLSRGRSVIDPQELRSRALGQIRELLGTIAAAQPLVLVVEDLHAADDDSLVLLRELLRPPETPPLLLVGTMRTNVLADLPQVDDEVVVEVALGPLEPPAARQLARELLAHTGVDDSERADALAAASRGHPLYIDELVRHVEIAGLDGDLRLEDVIATRVADLETALRRALEVIALAGAPLPAAIIGEAAGLAPIELQRALSALRILHLTRSVPGQEALVEPFHDHVRRAVAENLAPERAQEIHRTLVGALEASGTASELIVHHLEATGDLQRAGERAVRAAEHALESLSFDRAAALYRKALALGELTRDRQRELQLRAADCLASAGRGVDAAQLFDAAADGADDATRLDCHRQAAEQLLRSGHIERGLASMRALLSEIGVELPTTPRRALMSLLWHRARLRLRGLRWRERHEREIADTTLTRLDAYKSVTYGLGMVDTLRGADFHARGLLLALRAGEPTRVVRSIAHEALFRASQGGSSLRKARVLYRRASEIAGQRPGPYLRAWMVGADAFIAHYEGDFERSLERNIESVSLFTEETVGSASEINTMRMIRMLTLRYLGAFDLARDHYERQLADAVRRGDLYAESTLRLSGNFVWLAADRPDRALADLDGRRWPRQSGSVHLQHWYELDAEAQCALYSETAWDYADRLAAGLSEVRRSLLDRVVSVRTGGWDLEGRFALARAAAGELEPAAATAAALRLGRRLRGERLAHCDVLALLLEGGAAVTGGDLGVATERMAMAARTAEAAAMRVHAAVAVRRRGQLLGGRKGAGLVAEADQRLRAAGVAAPDRMAALVAPGAYP